MAPEYIYYLSSYIKDNEFLVCADEHLYNLSISEDNTLDLKISLPNAHTKILNMCEATQSGDVFTCSRDPTIKLWDMSTQLVKTEYTGHTMSITSIAST